MFFDRFKINPGLGYGVKRFFGRLAGSLRNRFYCRLNSLGSFAMWQIVPWLLSDFRSVARLFFRGGVMFSKGIAWVTEGIKGETHKGAKHWTLTPLV